eukprot:COSAG02_NODE_20_length_53673_cov_86.864841_4_plen_176_part_00
MRRSQRASADDRRPISISTDSHRNLCGWECAVHAYTCAGQALARGENLDKLVEKTDHLRYVPFDPCRTQPPNAFIAASMLAGIKVGREVGYIGWHLQPFVSRLCTQLLKSDATQRAFSRQSVNFKRQAREIKRSYWAKNVKVMLLCVFIVVIIIYCIVAFGFDCGLTLHCDHSGK